MKKYQVIILAAGLGSRMRSMTNSTPKTLIKVKDKPLLKFIMNSIDKKFCSEIIVVVGYKAEKIKKYLGNKNKNIKIRYIYNPIYFKTNSTYSMWLASPYFKKNILIINADTIFEKKILSLLINSKFQNALAIDDHIDIPLPDEAMKATINRHKRIINVSKKIPAKRTDGDAIGIYKFNSLGINFLKKELNNLVKKNNTKNLFTLAVKNILNRVNIYAVSTNKAKWIEIDDIKDLKKARKIF